MNTYRYLGSMILCCIIFSGISALAQQPGALPDIPRVISYQGMLTSNTGSPLADGEYQATVTLYGDENGAVTVWRDTYTITAQGGIFNIYLGSGATPLPSPDRMNRPLWVGMQLAGTDEMRPLTRLSASPYAINVPDKSITTNKIADGAVTKDKVQMDYIEGISVNGRKIEVNGKPLNIQGGDNIDVRYDEATQSLVIGSKPVERKGGLEDKSKDRELQGTKLDASGNTTAAGRDSPPAAVVLPGVCTGNRSAGIRIAYHTAATIIIPAPGMPIMPSRQFRRPGSIGSMRIYLSGPGVGPERPAPPWLRFEMLSIARSTSSRAVDWS